MAKKIDQKDAKLLHVSSYNHRLGGIDAELVRDIFTSLDRQPVVLVADAEGSANIIAAVAKHRSPFPIGVTVTCEIGKTLVFRLKITGLATNIAVKYWYDPDDAAGIKYADHDFTTFKTPLGMGRTIKHMIETSILYPQRTTAESLTQQAKHLRSDRGLTASIDNITFAAGQTRTMITRR